jgi:type IV secretory pathway TrbF-like protein
MSNKKKDILYKINKFICKLLSLHTEEEIDDKNKLENYFIYLDYVGTRSLNTYTNKVYPPFNDSEKKVLQEIMIYLPPAAQKIILQTSVINN